MFALVDCNSFFGSVDKVFHVGNPSLFFRATTSHPIAAQLHQVAIGIAQVEALHLALRPVSNHDALDDVIALGCYFLLECDKVFIYYEAEVLRTILGIAGGGRELTLYRMHTDFPTGEIEVVVSVVGEMLHAEKPDVEIEASFEMGCGYDQVVDMVDSHI